MAQANDILKHYSDIAHHYDELYDFSMDYKAEFAVKHLQLKPGDHLVDIGAGTGRVSSLIWENAGLSSPVLCVDPSADMLRVAETRDGVEPYLATADSFFKQALFYTHDQPKYQYNKILIIAGAHLFPDAQETFRKAYEYLPVDGVLLLIQRSNVCSIPVWQAMKENPVAGTSVDMFRSFLERAGFDVTVTIEVGTTKMSKGKWYEKLRRRIFTVLHECSDEQIEDGLRELDQEWFPGTKESDLVEIKDNLACFTATKKLH